MTVAMCWIVWTGFVLFRAGMAVAEILTPIAIPALFIVMLVRGNIHSVEESDIWLAVIPGFVLWAGVVFVAIKAGTKTMR